MRFEISVLTLNGPLGRTRPNQFLQTSEPTS